MVEDEQLVLQALGAEFLSPRVRLDGTDQVWFVRAEAGFQQRTQHQGRLGIPLGHTLFQQPESRRRVGGVPGCAGHRQHRKPMTGVGLFELKGDVEPASGHVPARQRDGLGGQVRDGRRETDLSHQQGQGVVALDGGQTPLH